MDKTKKFNGAIRCVDVGEGKRRVEYLQVGKEWVQSKTVGGYGLKKGTFLSFVKHKWNQSIHRNDENGEFYIYSKEFCNLCGMDRKLPFTYAHEFNKKGFYELRKQESVVGNTAVNSFWYKPNGSFPVFNDAWNVPMPMIRPPELGGFGLTAGMIFYYLIDKSLLNKSETIKIVQTQICKFFSVTHRDVSKILNLLVEAELMKFDQGICVLDRDFIEGYFTEINEFWENHRTKGKNTNPLITIKKQVSEGFLDLVGLFK